MRVAIVGCGAIGGHLAVKCGQAGASISVLARGQTLSALQRNGAVLKNDHGAAWQVPVVASANAADLGQQDVVLVCVKTTALVDIAHHLPSLMHANTRVVFVINGLPWWYLNMLCPDQGVWSAPVAATISALSAVVSPDQVLGGIANSANHVVSPGVVWNSNPTGSFVFGKPSGGPDSVATELAALVSHHEGVGIASNHVVDDVWRKLYSNIITHTMGSLTGATSQDLMSDPDLQPLNLQVVGELLKVARACGCALPDEAFGFVRGTAGHKSSMLQDFEMGRKPEIDSLLVGLVDLAHAKQVNVPLLEMLLVVLRKKALVQGIYP